jgi:hypothetical protein
MLFHQFKKIKKIQQVQSLCSNMKLDERLKENVKEVGMLKDNGKGERVVKQAKYQSMMLLLLIQKKMLCKKTQGRQGWMN